MKLTIYGIAGIAQNTIVDHWLTKLLVAIVGGMIGFALPTEAAKTTALCAMALVGFDFITAVIAVSKDPKQKIESSKMSRTISKIVLYAAMLAVIAVATRNLPGVGGEDGSNGVLGFTVMGVLGWVCLTESISILENITRAGIILPPGLREWVQNRVGKETKT